MSYELLRIFAFVAIAVLIAQVTLGLWLHSRSRHYRRVRRTEKLRLQIGDARCRLVNAAANGELSPKTATFQQLYFVQTSLMRGTDHYPALSDAFWTKVLRFEKQHESALTKEAKNWTPEVRALAAQTAEAIRHIWILYMPCGTLLRVLKHLFMLLGFVSYEVIERFCDTMLNAMVRAAEGAARLVTIVSFRFMRSPSFGLEVRLAHDMRETERILRNVLSKAA